MAHQTRGQPQLNQIYRQRKRGLPNDGPPNKRQALDKAQSSTVTQIPAEEQNAQPVHAKQLRLPVFSRPKPEWVSEVVSSLRQRMMSGTPGWSAGAIQLTEDQSTLEGQLKRLIKDTVVGAHNNSALLLGPRGTGKSLVLERALSDAASEHPEHLVAVRLSGIVHTDDQQALRSVAQQLCDQQRLAYSKSASFEENMTFLHDMLSECARAQRSVVFVLDEFDLFATRPKQTLLYTILNAMHSSQVQAVLLGVSCRLDAAELLEKRVLSRFSHRKLVFSVAGGGVDAATSLMTSALTVQVDDDVDKEKAAYMTRFNETTQRVLASEPVRSALALPATLDSSHRRFCEMAAVALTRMDREEGVLRAADVEFACAESMRGALTVAMSGCSVLELWMLVAMHRLKSRRKRAVASFSEAYAECTANGSAVAQSVESYGRMCAKRSWENLVNMELLKESGSRGRRTRRAGSQFHQARLLVPECLIQEMLQKHKQVPTLLQAWMRTECA
mmetsp:Transcript_25109/g.47456  ORF Transcript_25109/g.47456 Transcript_25109/m.47456 type:complete len:502 (-) Transcript_25109:143-1648(-)|eukprot:CAMPEP_0114255814 /NCGR_PEP_ID=MMETSP0058-20121206/17782_1 /TAXON_ID=36894 /ORGANISM="Pyramimonas parkeae, CCMP726" /LENGTH=501 /DNA_ID=CAMNT_0001370263 /DNA_START=232 /DNA_END=1737 /DNA_ORIENTATION=+